MSTMLSGDYIVKTFLNGVTALNALRESDEKPDVIVSDIKMPGLTGLNMLEKISNEEIQVPVIFVTGFANKSIALQALDFGAYALLEKPIQIEMLKSVVRRATDYMEAASIAQELVESQAFLIDTLEMVKTSYETRLQKLEEHHLKSSGDSNVLGINLEEEHKKEEVLINLIQEKRTELDDFMQRMDFHRLWFRGKAGVESQRGA